MLYGGTLTLSAGRRVLVLPFARCPLRRGGRFHLRELLAREERLGLGRPGLFVGVFDGAPGLVGEVAAGGALVVDKPQPVSQRGELRAQRLGLGRVLSREGRLLAPVLGVLELERALEFPNLELQTGSFLGVSLGEFGHSRLLAGEPLETLESLVALLPETRYVVVVVVRRRRDASSAGGYPRGSRRRGLGAHAG